MNNEMASVIDEMRKDADYANRYFSLKELFEGLSDICEAADRKIVLMIDEVDSAANNQVFIDFLAQLRAQYLDREFYPGFQSVILAGVYDIKNLKRKLRPEEGHRYNSPWNIAADFSIEMSFSESEIAGMLQEYEIDHRTGMNISKMSELLYAYTAGYPFLVSRICQLMDERVRDEYENLKLVWTENGFNEAVRILLAEKNPLFESLVGKICDYPELSVMLKTLLLQEEISRIIRMKPRLIWLRCLALLKIKMGMWLLQTEFLKRDYIIIILQKQRCSRQRYIRQPCRTRVSL